MTLHPGHMADPPHFFIISEGGKSKSAQIKKEKRKFYN